MDCCVSATESLDGHLVLERPPAYALERNPVEYIWGYMQQRESANPCFALGDSMRSSSDTHRCEPICATEYVVTIDGW